MSDPQDGGPATETDAAATGAARIENGPAADETGQSESQGTSESSTDDAGGSSAHDDGLFDDLFESSEFDARGAVGELRQEVEALGSFRESARRELGQVGALQRDLRGFNDRLSGVDLLAQQVGVLTEALVPTLDEGARSRLAELTSKAQVQAEVAARLAEHSAPANPGVPPVTAQSRAAAEAREVGQRILVYAEAKGVDATAIPQNVWDRAESESGGDYRRAEGFMRRAVDRLADRKTRRSERKAAGAGQVSAERAGAGASTLTLDRLRAMTAEQIQELDQDEVNKVLAQGA